MKHSVKPLSGFILSSNTSEQLRHPLELAIVSIIIVTLTVFAIQATYSNIIHSQITEAASLVLAPRTELTVYRALNGHWPENNASSEAWLEGIKHKGKYTEQITLRNNGAILITFSNSNRASQLDEQKLSFRPAYNPSDTSSPVIWVCAAHHYPEELTISGLNETTIENDYLPSFCRSY